MRSRNSLAALLPFALATTAASPASSPPPARETPLTLAQDDVIPTGNDWIALPSIRAGDGALTRIEP